MKVQNVMRTSLLIFSLSVILAGCTASTTLHFRNDTNEQQNVDLNVGRDGKAYLVGAIGPGGTGFCKLDWPWDADHNTSCHIRANRKYTSVILNNYQNGINHVDLFFSIQNDRIEGPSFSMPPAMAEDYPEGGDAPAAKKTTGPGPSTPLAPPPAN